MMLAAMRVLVPAALLPWLTTAALAAAAGSTAAPEDLDSTRATLARWVQTQETISRERKDWQQGREMLRSRIDVVKKEISLLEETMSETRGQRSEAQKGETEVRAGIASVKEITDELAVQAGRLEEKVRTLYRTLPDSLKERVRPLYDRMPQGPTVTGISLAERFQNILGILNEMGKINSEITVVSEIRPLSDGKPSEVKTVYLGLGQAYFVSAGGEAGVGHPSADGWTWRPANDLAPQINEVLEMLQNKSSPRFVPLPVEIR